MQNMNAPLRLFHGQNSVDETQPPVAARHEESSTGVASTHLVREPGRNVHEPRVSGHWELGSRPESALEAPHSLASIRAMAHALSIALTERSETVDPSEWRLRVAAAQARAIEDILAGVDD